MQFFVTYKGQSSLLTKGGYQGVEIFKAFLGTLKNHPIRLVNGKWVALIWVRLLLTLLRYVIISVPKYLAFQLPKVGNTANTYFILLS